jgi:tetratricopeptide (TPR) repeat protein
VAAALFALALRAYQAGRFGEAADHCRAALRNAPDHAPALKMLAAILSAAGRLEEALPIARRAAAAASDDAEAQGALGALLLRSGDAAQALAPLDRALRRQPRNAGLLNSRASALQALGRFAEALAAYDKALAAGPPHPEAVMQRGHILLALKRPVEALASYDKALALQIDAARGEYARGNALLALGRSGEAADSFERVLARAPGHSDALNNLTVAYRLLGRDDDALALYERLLATDISNDHARFGRAQIHLAHGRFAAGWDDYRARRSVAEHRGLIDQARLGQSLAGETLWLRKDQGLGDELFFLRFAPQLKRRGARIVYQSGAKIASLLRRAPVLGEVLDAVIDETDLIPDRARVLSVGDMPFALGHASADETPPPLPLAPVAALAVAAAERLRALGPPPYIGVTWRSGAADSEALHKEVPDVALAEALAALPGTLLSLQRLPRPGETEALAAAAHRVIHDLSALNDDLEAMLALLAALDDYVAVSNTNVHLRASAGLASRVLVPMPAEWRWMAGGDESPWFPGSRVYRQAAGGDWSAALACLSADLIAVFSRATP